MDYEEFKKQVAREVKERLPGCKITTREVQKNNGIVLDGLMISEQGKAVNVSPTIYINEFYPQYEKGQGLGEITGEIVQLYEKAKVQEEVDVTGIMDFDRVKDRIVYRLINRKMNDARLKDMPYKPCMGDLAVIFAVLLESVGSTSAVIEIHNDHAKDWGISADGLMELAERNTPALLEPKLSRMGDILKESLGSDEGMARQAMGDSGCKEAFPMYVLTNSGCVQGAACVLYPGVLQGISEKLGDDLCIIPSSTHEVLIIPKRSAGDPGDVEKMIKEVNATQVAQMDILSDHPYYFEREAGKVAPLLAPAA